MMRYQSALIDSLPLNTRVQLVADQHLIRVMHEGQCIEELNRTSYPDIFQQRAQFDALIKEDGIMPIRYAGLHQHSWYSLLDGLVSPKQMAEIIEYAGAISDHGNMFGYYEFYLAMTQRGKKPIIGLEAYVENWNAICAETDTSKTSQVDESSTQSEPSTKEKLAEDTNDTIIKKGRRQGNHLLLLAENNVGCANLIKLASLAWENVYRKPHLTWEWLETYSEGIICTTACLGGELSQCLLEADYEGAKNTLQQLIHVFGQHNVYVEIQRHEIEEEIRVNPLLESIANELQLKIVAGTDSHYAYAEDDYIHELQLCMQTGKKYQDPHFKFSGTHYHMQTSDEMEVLFADHPEWLDHTLEVAERCQVTLQIGDYKLPEFPLPEPFQTQAEYFRYACLEGFQKRYQGMSHLTSPEYLERLEFEMNVIEGMGFPGYFNIVADFVQYAKQQGILVGPGRGSACGSLVAYVLFITDIDPIEYDLLFERFLNPDRVSMPDIDIDFQDDRREEVIDYVKTKYGIDAISRIGTIGTLAARNAIRDVARVLVYEKSEFMAIANKICKTIPEKPGMTLQKAMEESAEFQTLYHSNDLCREIIDIAFRMEGLPRQTGMHACGVLISPDAVSNFVPQFKAVNTKTKLKEYVTQVTMGECEELGMLKMDFLGLRTLGVFSEAIELINQRPDIITPIDFNTIPTEDLNVYEMLAKGQTVGVFQLESAGMTDLMRKMYQDLERIRHHEKAGRECFERLVAGLALYRPGPMDEIPNYIRFMLHPQEIHYDIPEIAQYLNSTYSIITYQEQCMFIVRELAGFSKGQSDYFRKGMAKKNAEVMAKCKKWFIEGSVQDQIDGCVKRGYHPTLVESLWDKMEKFGAYAFNRSHAVGYGEISAKSAWLACYYPVEYMTATLNSYINNADRIRLYMSQCSQLGISVLPPHINYSQEHFSVEGNNIRFGLRGIRNLGTFSQHIIETRQKVQSFKSYQHTAMALAYHTGVSKTHLEAMIYSGALDDFELTRKGKLALIPTLLELKNYITQATHKGQPSFLSLFLPEQQPTTWQLPALSQSHEAEFERRYKLEKEYEFTGFYITEHPMDEYLHLLKNQHVEQIGMLLATAQSDDEMEEEGLSDTSISYSLNRPNTTTSTSSDDDSEHFASTIYQSGDRVEVAGILKDIVIRYGHRDKRAFATFKMEDRTGTISCVMFSNDYERQMEWIEAGNILCAKGEFKINDFGPQLIVSSVINLETQPSLKQPTALQIIGSLNLLQARLQYSYLKGVLAQHQNGTLPVYFHNRCDGQDYELPYRLVYNDPHIEQLIQVFGSDYVSLQY